jgi:uncharacterized membrane protein
MGRRAARGAELCREQREADGRDRPASAAELVTSQSACAVEDGRSALPWLVAALLLYLAVIVITLAVKVPLNDGIKAAGDPDRIADLGAVRDRFNEATRIHCNLVRAIACTTAYGCLSWALVLHRRT